MKKMISFILLFCLCFTFAACGKNTPAPANSGTEPDPSSSGQSSEQSGGQQTETGEPRITSINLREKAGAESVYDMFDYGDGFVGVVIVKTVDGERKMFLRFIDTNYGWLADGEYELGAWDHCIIVDRGDSHYVCCDNTTVEVSGDPRANVKVEKLDSDRRYEHDDERFLSPDGKWYATRTAGEPDKRGDAMLVNIETGEEIVPYVGVNNGNFEDTTASMPLGFAGDKFIFNVSGYEWMNGYGVYDISTGETQLFDNLIDVGVFPCENHLTERVPYIVDRTEFGYIDLSNPGVRVPLYNREKSSVSEYEAQFRDTLEGSDYFHAFSGAGGRYLCVAAESAQNGLVFAAYDMQTFEKICEHKEAEYSSADVLSGNSVVFMINTVSESRALIITLP